MRQVHERSSVTDLWVSMPSIRVQVELGSSTLNRPISAWSVYVELCMVSVSRDIGVNGTLFGFLLYFYGNSIRAPLSVFCFVFSVSVSNRTKAKLRMTLGTVGHEWVKNDSEPAKIFSDIGHLDIFCTPYFQDSLEIAVL